MVSVKQAVRVIERYIGIDGSEKAHTALIFEGDDVERAETIVTALKGMTIESAQDLLERIGVYLLQDIIR